MIKALKYRICPTKIQQELLEKHFGCVRFVYNWALDRKKSLWDNDKTSITTYELQKELTVLKQEFVWLKEVNVQSLQQAIQNVDTAFSNFCKHKKEFPKFKAKNHSNFSFKVINNLSIDFKNNRIKIPKFQYEINIILHRPIKGIIKSATISRTSTGKYFASILVDTQQEQPSKPKVQSKTTITLDLGIKDFATLSDGTKIKNPTFLNKEESKLKFLQRKASKHKGKRTKLKLAKKHEKISNRRKDFLHKTSSKLISENQTIIIEDLAIKNLSKRYKPKQGEDGKYLPNGQAAKSGLNRRISDVGWGMFVDMLTYKADWYGVNLIKIGRFEPSSKRCSNCKAINKDLTLKDRVWSCVECGITHDRDINAAINIKQIGLRDHVIGMRNSYLKSKGAVNIG